MNINLVGALGGGNFGDEFILNSCIKKYAKKQPVTFFISGFDKNFSLSSFDNISEEGASFFQSALELRAKSLNGHQN